jgi:hypothetical protein
MIQANVTYYSDAYRLAADRLQGEGIRGKVSAARGDFAELVSVRAQGLFVGSFRRPHADPTRCLARRFPSPMRVNVGGRPQASGMIEQSQI